MALDFFGGGKTTSTTNQNYQDSFNKTLTNSTGYSDVGNIEVNLGKPAAAWSVQDLLPIAIVGGLALLAFRELKR